MFYVCLWIYYMYMCIPKMLKINNIQYFEKSDIISIPFCGSNQQFFSKVILLLKIRIVSQFEDNRIIVCNDTLRIENIFKDT